MPALVAVAIVAGVLGALALRPRDAAPEVTFKISNVPLASPQIAFAPDGQSMVIAPRLETADALVVRRLDSVETTTLPGTEGAIFPFWSPDGKSIGFFSAKKLKRIDLSGAVVTEIADAGLARGGFWQSDDTILYAPNVSAALYRISAHGGSPVQVTQLTAGQSDHRAPQVLPGGRHFIFYARGTPQARGVYVANIDGSNPTRLLDAAAAAQFVPPGLLLFPREDQLLAQSFDPESLELNGESFLVSDAIAINRGISLAALASSSQGAIAFGTGRAARTQMQWLDRTGKMIGAVGSPDTTPWGNAAISPDGAVIALNRVIAGNWDVWLQEARRGVLTRLTTQQGLDFVPLWMPDGRHVVFQSSRNERTDLYRRSATGEGDEELLLSSPLAKSPMAVSPDGRFLLFGQEADIWVLPLDGRRQARPFVSTPFVEGARSFRPTVNGSHTCRMKAAGMRSTCGHFPALGPAPASL